MQVLNSPRLAWTVAALLMLAIALLIATGTVRLPGLHEDYAASARRLAEADRSQTPRMTLVAQYPGPLQDTTIQRWQDPVDGTVCYIYLPIAVANSAGPNGLVQYGSAHIGSVSCFPQPR